MSLQVSTMYKSLILGPAAFEDIFKNGVIRVFSGSQPSNADQPEQGLYLGMFTLNGGPWIAGQTLNGLTFYRQGPYISKAVWDVWQFRLALHGTAGWFRIVGNAPDDGGASITLPRIDGSIGVSGSGAQMILPSISFELGGVYPLEGFLYTIPPIVG